jgi:tRNA1Val (adenine37-N6)-methyltransferase
MKVCTDACLFGAIVADELKHEQVLDIGAGTGLLSLMYAQKNPSSIIHSVEIDSAAAEQAKGNYRGSVWNKRIEIYNCDVNEFNSDTKYDLILSNPPFFEQDLLSEQENRNAAKHHSTLNLKQLLSVANSKLKTSGFLAVLFPERRLDHFESEAMFAGLHVYRKILVRQTPEHDIFRGILFLKKETAKPLITEMSIKRTDGHYTAEFISFLKDYYLFL